MTRSESKTGARNPMYGKKVSEETNKKRSESLKRYYENNDNPMLNRHHTEEVKKKIGKASKEREREPLTEEQRRKMSKAAMGRLGYWKGKKLYKTAKEKIKKAKIKIWQNPEYREKNIKAMLKGLFKEPTSLEKQFIDIIKKHSLPYRYVGDGSLLIGFKCPDFVNTDGKKICIEVRPKRLCHVYDKCSSEEYKKQRIKHFAKYGWKCLVIWEEDLSEENLIRRMSDN